MSPAYRYRAGTHLPHFSIQYQDSTIKFNCLIISLSLYLTFLVDTNSSLKPAGKTWFGADLCGLCKMSLEVIQAAGGCGGGFRKWPGGRITQFETVQQLSLCPLLLTLPFLHIMLAFIFSPHFSASFVTKQQYFIKYLRLAVYGTRDQASSHTYTGILS